MGSAKSKKPASRSWGKTQVSTGRPSCSPTRCTAKRRDPEDVEPGGDGHRLPPVGEAALAGQVGLLDAQAVGDHLVVRGRRHPKLAGGLVVGVVDGGQPVARLVGPVVAEERAVAVLVLADEQAGGGDAVIAHGERRRAPPPGSAVGQGHAQPIAGMLEAERLGAAGHAGHDHPAALAFRRRLDQVELEAHSTVAGEAQVDRGLAIDFVGRVAQDEGKGVVERRRARVAGGTYRPWPLGRLGRGSRPALRRDTTETQIALASWAKVYARPIYSS